MTIHHDKLAYGKLAPTSETVSGERIEEMMNELNSADGGNLRFVKTDGNDKAFHSLCAELDEYMDEVEGVNKAAKAVYEKLNALDDIHDVYLAYDNDIPAGCVSFKKYDGESAEIKRVFVREQYRKSGIGRKLLTMLEADVRQKGYKYLILETGKLLTAAMKLYHSLGFENFPNYGAYADMPNSVCMKKTLK